MIKLILIILFLIISFSRTQANYSNHYLAGIKVALGKKITGNLILKDIIAAKRKNPYTENKTIEQLCKETATAGTLTPLPDNTKFKRMQAENVCAEWITCGDFDTDKTFMLLHGSGYYKGSIAATRATVARISAEAKFINRI